jgi:acetyl esterase/lipase
MSGAASKSAESNGQFAAFPPSLDDAEAALRLVRAKAADWHIDPKRVGMIGFSAGAITTVALGISGPPDARPDFIAPIYGWMKPVEVPADAPPMFSALAADDPLMGQQGYGIVESWHKANRPVELHVYEHGSHGFGADGMPGTTSTHWKEEFYWWMEARGLLK